MMPCGSEVSELHVADLRDPVGKFAYFHIHLTAGYYDICVHARFNKLLEIVHADDPLVDDFKHFVEDQEIALSRGKNFAGIVEAVADIDRSFLLLLRSTLQIIDLRFFKTEDLDLRFQSFCKFAVRS